MVCLIQKGVWEEKQDRAHFTVQFLNLIITDILMNKTLILTDWMYQQVQIDSR